MNLVNGLTVSGQAAVTGAPTSPVHVTRLQELTAGLALKSSLGHTHDVSEITGLTTALLTTLAGMLGATTTIEWVQSGGLVVGANVKLTPNGGLVAGPDGVQLDSGVSRAGHTHVSAEVTDLAAGVLATMATILEDSASVTWMPSGTAWLASVRPKASGGLVVTADGVAIDFGTSHVQVPYGDHTHSGIHPAATITSNGSLAVAQSGQDFTVTVQMAGAGGLLLGPSGVGLDFGTGATQAARGNHTHGQLHAALTAQGDASLALGVGSDQVLSGTVRVDPAPGAGYGKIAKGAGGLKVALGTAADTAAEGDHVHDAATTGSDGFMSAADKLTLTQLQAASGTTVRRSGVWVRLEGDGSDIPLGIYDYIVMPDSGTITGWDLTTAGPSGTLSVDILKGTWAAFPPTSSMVGGFKPLVSGTHNQNLTVAWAFQRGDVLAMKVDGCVGVKRATLGLRIVQ